MKPPPKICLVSPNHLASNPRLVKEADALTAAGYDVDVVAANLAASLRTMDRTILARARWRCTLVKRPALPVYVWLTFRQRISQWLLGRGFMRWGRAALARSAHHRLTGTLGRVAARIPADLYHAHNLGALPAAAHAARVNGAKLGFDAEDFHSGELTEEQENPGSREARRVLEAEYLRRCDLLTAASPGIAEEYRELHGVAMEPLLNVFSLDEAPARQQTDDQPANAPLRLYWFSQTIGAGRGLEQLVAALGRMQHPAQLHLRGQPVAGFVESLRSQARQAGFHGTIHLLPSLPPGELIRGSATYDLGLGLEMNYPRNRAICLTNKIFVYLLAGLPVLLSRTPAQEAISPQLGLAARLVDLEDPGATARCLDEFAADASARREARATAWTLGQERYNWDLEQASFLDRVRATVGSPV